MTALDEAFDRLAAAPFELPDGFVNHGAMACEALATLGFDQEVGTWSRRFARISGPRVTSKAAVAFQWPDALGDYRRLPELIGFFEQAIETDGWPAVAETYIPRLMPGLSTALFHGAIRTAHALRAIDRTDTAPRRQELARALGYWAARFQPSSAGDRGAASEDISAAVVAAAADAARHYLAEPSIFQLHGVTGAMAVHLLLPHLDQSARHAALAQLTADHAALFGGSRSATDVAVSGVPDGTLISSAEASGDPHQVKLVEAAFRARAFSGDPVFTAAAEKVTAAA